MPLTEGSKLGPYEIISLTGAGGMGEVYKAKDTRLDRIVAVKVLPSQMADNIEIKQRFEREAKSISSLNHPNICILHDIGTHEGVDYLVMEYLEGQTLYEKLQSGPLANEDLIKYSLQIVDALDKAHKQGLVHRDLKPSNVMITKDGAKLLDFGLAKLQVPASGIGDLSEATMTSTPLTEKGTIIGTFQYMSPEQLEGEEADARSDIFAFGAMLYEMVTGKRAFTGNSKASLIASVLKEEPQPVSQVQPLAPPMFERIIKQCLAKDADDRWQTAGDLKHALEWIAEGGSQVGIPRTLSAKRKRNTTIAMVLASLFFISTAYLAFIQFTLPVEEKLVTRFTIEMGQGLSSIAWPRISPDGKLVAFRATDSLGTGQIWVRPLNSLEGYPLFGTDNAGRHYWSADSKNLIYFDGNKLMKVPVTGGQSQLICEGPNGADCTWGSKDIILFDGGAADPINMVSANGGLVTKALELDTAAGDKYYAWPWFLPDGENFIFVANSVDSAKKAISKLKLGSTTSPVNRTLYELLSFGRIEYSQSGHILFIQDNNLMALPFDDEKLEVTGEPKPIAQKIGLSRNARVFGMSDNGTLLYHSSNTSASSQLIWLDREGKELSKVGEQGSYRDVVLSPDETKFVYTLNDPQTGSDNIWIYDLKRNVPTKFTFDPENEVWPIWSPDGDTIYYASDRNGNYEILKKNINGLDEAELVHKNDSGLVGPNSFTPDGRILLFNFFHSNRDIGILHLDDSNRVDMFANTSFYENQAKVSPNGKYVAYISSESNRRELYVRQLDGKGGKWQISNEGANYPNWRADGKELYYKLFTNDFVAIPVNTDGAFEAGNPTVLFNAPTLREGIRLNSYDVTGDGQRFILNAPINTSASKQLIVVLNMNEQI